MLSGCIVTPSPARSSSDAYFALLDEFMHAIRSRWPKALVQFGASVARRQRRAACFHQAMPAATAEDFSSDKAADILQKYRQRHLCFNDDIQGTGATTLAGVLSALQTRGETPADLVKQRVVVVGAGSAGLGVATTLLQGMVHQGATPEVCVQSSADSMAT